VSRVSNSFADAWSLGVTPAEVRDGFVQLYFGPVQVLLLDPPAGLRGMDRLRARRVIDSANFATNYGALDAWLADIRALGVCGFCRMPCPTIHFHRPRTINCFFLQFPLLAAWALNRAASSPPRTTGFAASTTRPNRGRSRARFDFDSVLELGPDADPDRVREAGANWLDDPLDPRLIARRRRGVYLRHAALMMVRNLLDWADHEFAQEDAESVDRARQLYLLARRALDAPEFDRCDAAIRTLEIRHGHARAGICASRPWTRPARDSAAVRIRQRAVLDEAITKVRNLAESMHGGKLAKAIDKVVTQALRDDARRTPKVKLEKTLARRRESLGVGEDALLFGFTPGARPRTGP
jgi:hypothetical protein